MKKSILGILGVCLLAVSVYSAPKKLRVVGSFSSLAMFSEFEKPYWKKEIKKQFPNIKTRITSIGQIKLKGAAVYRQLGKGTFDVVSTIGGYLVADSETIAGLDLPAIAPDIETARKVSDAYKPVLERAIAKDFNSKLIAIEPYPAQILFCKDKVDSLADLKGKRVRAGSWTLSEFLDGIGATGVTMQYGAIAQALQRGVLDCAIAGGLPGYAAGWGDITKYLYPIPVGGWAYVLTSMNMDTWNKFSKKEKAKLLSTYDEKVTQKVWKKSAFESVEAVKCLTGKECSYGKANNMKLVKFKNKDLALSRKILLNNVLPKWAGKVSKKTLKEWNNTVGKIVNLEARR